MVNINVHCKKHAYFVFYCWLCMCMWVSYQWQPCRGSKLFMFYSYKFLFIDCSHPPPPPLFLLPKFITYVPLYIKLYLGTHIKYKPFYIPFNQSIAFLLVSCASVCLSQLAFTQIYANILKKMSVALHWII